MAWGSAILDIAGAALGGKVGSGVSFLGNLMGYAENEQRSKKSENEYYAALAQQKALAKLQMDLAAQQANWDNALRSTILNDTNTQTSAAAAAQNAMGAMPQFNEAKLTADYSNTKAYMMNDFMDALSMIESQGRANQIERLGTATSTTADNDRLRSLMKQYTPELAKIDNEAMNQALNRQTNTMNLYNTNRKNTLDEITGIYQQGITNKANLLQNMNAAGAGDAASGSAQDVVKEALTRNTSESSQQGLDLNRMRDAISRTFGNSPISQETPGNRMTTSDEWAELMRRS